MRIGSVSDFVDSFEGGIYGSIKSNRVIGTIKVVVNRTRTSHCGYLIFIIKHLGSCKSTISANSYQTFNAMGHQVFVGFFSTFRSHKIFTTCRLKYGSTTLYYV